MKKFNMLSCNVLGPSMLRRRVKLVNMCMCSVMKDAFLVLVAGLAII